MKVEIIDYKASDANQYEYRLNVAVRYNKRSYAVSVTCYHDFKDGKPFVKYINSFSYLSNVERKSKVRDEAIKKAIQGMQFEF